MVERNNQASTRPIIIIKDSRKATGGECQKQCVWAMAFILRIRDMICHHYLCSILPERRNAF